MHTIHTKYTKNCLILYKVASIIIKQNNTMKTGVPYGTTWYADHKSSVNSADKF